MTGITSVFLILYFMDFQIPNLYKNKSTKSEVSINVLSANLGGNLETAPWVKRQLLAEQIDIGGFQEISKKLGGYATPKDWYSHCLKGLCVISRYEISYLKEESESISNRNGYSQYVGLYDVDIQGRSVRFANIHLETPRKAYTNLVLKDMSLDPFYDNVIQRYVEAKSVRALIDKYKPSFVLGDFNMPVESVIYKENFDEYINAFEDKGFGFGYTKYTSLHGVRIDHIISVHDFAPLSAKIGLDVGSDHRPIIAKLSLDERTNLSIR